MEKIKQERIIISHYFYYFIMLLNKFTFFIEDINNIIKFIIFMFFTLYQVIFYKSL